MNFNCEDVILLDISLLLDRHKHPMMNYDRTSLDISYVYYCFEHFHFNPLTANFF